MRLGIAFSLYTVFGLVAAGHAQSTLSQADVAVYEGTWLLDPLRSGLTEADAERRVITTGPTWMRVDIYRAQDAQPISLMYNFDGSPTANPFGTGTAVSKLRREAHGLVTETVFTVKDQPVTVHELLPVRPEGSDLAIAVTLRVEHGYQGTPPALARTAPNVSKGTKLFRKQP
jgi:hypothetical protein